MLPIRAYSLIGLGLVPASPCYKLAMPQGATPNDMASYLMFLWCGLSALRITCLSVSPVQGAGFYSEKGG